MKLSSTVIKGKLITIGLCTTIAAMLITFNGCFQEPSKDFQQGQELFKVYCVACHGVNGGGVLYNKSRLNNDVLVTGDPDQVIAVILYGKDGEGTMPGWKDNLNDQEVAAVATYIRQAWSNRADPVSPAMVAEIRSKR